MKINKRTASIHNLLMQIKYKLKDYERITQERKNLIYKSSHLLDGMPKADGVTDPTQKIAVKIAAMSTELNAIDQATAQMKKKYSVKTEKGFDPITAYWNYDYFNYKHIRRNKDDEGPSCRTWNSYREAFGILIAQELNLI